jgi:hypothetical protein
VPPLVPAPVPPQDPPKRPALGSAPGANAKPPNRQRQLVCCGRAVPISTSVSSAAGPAPGRGVQGPARRERAPRPAQNVGAPPACGHAVHGVHLNAWPAGDRLTPRGIVPLRCVGSRVTQRGDTVRLTCRIVSPPPPPPPGLPAASSAASAPMPMPQMQSRAVASASRLPPVPSSASASAGSLANFW